MTEDKEIVKEVLDDKDFQNLLSILYQENDSLIEGGEKNSTIQFEPDLNDLDIQKKLKIFVLMSKKRNSALSKVEYWCIPEEEKLQLFLFFVLSNELLKIFQNVLILSWIC